MVRRRKQDASSVVDLFRRGYDEGNPTYSDKNPDGLSFTITTNGNVFGFLCPADHYLMESDDKNPAKCRSGAIIGNFPTCVNSTQIIGWVEYLLIVVIVVFLVILAGLWSWYAKDKMRVARLKRAAVDNRNGHPCIL
ncbi:hypothetical protein B566_EDAN017481 [Ephemera danica]|nr:hypothetical protein B566_EDAN017481 [Ephemera danica]